jgi:hypothetical protein
MFEHIIKDTFLAGLLASFFVMVTEYQDWLRG